MYRSILSNHVSHTRYNKASFRAELARVAMYCPASARLVSGTAVRTLTDPCVLFHLTWLMHTHTRARTQGGRITVNSARRDHRSHIAETSGPARLQCAVR